MSEVRSWAAVRALALCGAVALWVAGPARAVEFDSYLFIADNYLGGQPALIGTDNDNNGLPDDAHLGLLSALLDPSATPSCIASSRLTEIRNAYQTNLGRVATELTVRVSGQTVNILSALETESAGLGNAVQQLLTGYITLADPATLTFINNLIDRVVADSLVGTPQENVTATVQNLINFTAAEYLTYGSATPEPNYLGAAADLDADGTTNLGEWTASGANRETWIQAHCLSAALRLAALSGDGTFLTGRNHVFAAEAAGDAGPYTYQWFKRGVGTPVASGAVYNIPFLNTSNTGDYYVVVSSQNDTLTSPDLRLNAVYSNIFISKPIAGGTRNWGTSYTFTVEAQGGQPGPYRYTWLRDGVVVGPNAPTFTIPSLDSGDQGQYSVAVTSNGGGDTVFAGPVQLRVLPPNFRFTEQPQSAQPALGASQTFRVAVTGGSGDYRYDWQKDGQLLGIASTPELVINPVVAGSAGSYRCRVTDAADSSLSILSNAAVLSLAPDPLSVTQQPVGATKLVGDSHTFSVTVTGGSGIYNYQWRKGGTDIAGATQRTYTINPLKQNDAGTYTCFVRDQGFTNLTVTSAGAVLEITVPQLVILQQPSNVSASIGGTATFTIIAGGGSGNYAYNWRKNGTSLIAPSLPTLTISDVGLEDIAEYTCWVTDSGDLSAKVKSDPATLTVSAGELTIQDAPEGDTVKQGSNYTFRIKVIGGSGNYSYNWKRNGVSLGRPSAALLTLANVTPANNGTYTCEVTDTADNETITSPGAELVVLPPLAIAQSPQSATARPGEAITLSVQATGGSGNYGYSWFRNATALPSVNEPTYTINAVQAEDAGSYFCRVQDLTYPEDTVDSATANVVVVLPLSLTTPLSPAQVRFGTDVVLSIAVSGGSGNYTYDWRRNGASLGAPSAPTLSLPDATPANSGNYSCQITDAQYPDLALLTPAETLTVLAALSFGQTPASGAFLQGTNVTLTATAVGGTGQYNWAWFRDSTPIPGEVGPTLTLSNAQASATGNYVVAVQDKGFITDVRFSPAAFVVVVPPATISQQPVGGTVDAGQPFTTSIAVSGGSGAFQ